MHKRPASPADLPRSVPIFPLSGALLLPFSHRPLNIFEPRYVRMIDDALAGDRLIGLIQPLDTTEESPRGRADLQKVGCVGRLTHWEENGDDRYFVILEGVTRFELVSELTVMTPYRQATISATPFVNDFDREHGEEAVDRTRFLKMMRDYAEFGEFDLNWDEIEKTGTADLVNFCCMVSPYGAREKQVLLEAKSLADRAETLIALAEFEMAKAGEGAPVLQ
ncbi:LON peptidase substrate-binding domain-containing protein [Paradevosia shaoguanensis]|jgi:Lon protease-like protein|uniref:LON peptidase substrate-binding domain-containing protein n=1 Tax=Paradevosia shaoguanensis TaxID=1335043 RepID=A0AA41UCK7_9HYPH|nr:LON peptidase substrate-binding domain-containing protein [Paradevosia shaoguanensis]MCF1743854.1 LON peptidase substrate-binding domain-containing protein [Paradevosia shaoguanensis]MCI0128337.1 LON peptidase substrate-binding domain-containing protein [Paradevosia shaoguanensis]QMV00120.1 peptidase S16 [Devosia sp. D6-9]